MDIKLKHVFYEISQSARKLAWTHMDIKKKYMSCNICNVFIKFYPVKFIIILVILASLCSSCVFFYVYLKFRI